MAVSLQHQPTSTVLSSSISRTLSAESGLKPYPYGFDLECPVPWPSSQENAICQDYPFSFIQEESIEDFTIRRYLETLWLPESIMSLERFIHSLRRIPSSTSRPHPLLAALKPLLLSVRATQDKYHTELPQILQDGGGAGELEETVMWFAYSQEKFEPDAQAEDGEGVKREEEWKKSWMGRLERREVQIQILLYLQLLSLPAPPTPPRAPKTPKKPKRKQPHGPPTPAKPLFPPTSSVEAAVASIPPTPATSTANSIIANFDDNLTLDDRLEYFMDRLSLWQLVASLHPPGSSQATSSQQKTRDERDWMQIFCEDVVEPFFKARLPEQCALLRTKVFPHSPFSDDSDSASSPPPLDLHAIGKGKIKRKRPASPLRLAELQKSKPESSLPPSRHAESQEPGTAPDRHRSRSRSVSISVEEVRARGASRGGVASSKSLFKDEVEMKRAAPRVPRLSKPAPNEQSQGRTFSRQNSAANPFGSGAQRGTSQPCSPSRTREPRTLAADTPVKKPVKVEDNEVDVVMDSPDVLLLTGNSRGGSEKGEENRGPGIGTTFVVDTPVKRRPKRRVAP